MVIICTKTVKSLPKEKLGQIKVGSNIAQNRLFSNKKSKVKFGQVEVDSNIYRSSYDNMHDSGDTAH